MKKQFVSNKKTCKITFSLPKEATKGVKAVTVYGEFNDWKPLDLKKGKDGVFSKVIELATGKEYQFRYLLDNKRWENDWDADNYIPSPYTGIENSVVNVPTEAAAKKIAKVEKVASKKQKSSTKKAAKKIAKVAKKAKKNESKTAAKKTVVRRIVSTSKTAASPKKTVVKKATKKAIASKPSATAAPKKATAKASKKAASKKVTAKKASAKTTAKAASKKVVAKTTAKKKTGAKDDLKKIEGIGPKIAEHLNNGGIKTFAALGKASLTKLKGILEKAGPRYKMHVPDTWPQQAVLAAKGDWDALTKLQNKLNGGRK